MTLMDPGASPSAARKVSTSAEKASIVIYIYINVYVFFVFWFFLRVCLTPGIQIQPDNRFEEKKQRLLFTTKKCETTIIPKLPLRKDMSQRNNGKLG